MPGLGRGQGCRPALRPPSWPRPGRGPRASSAPPPSRRLLARVTPAEPRTPGWTRIGCGVLLVRLDRDPPPAWGRAQGRGSRGRVEMQTPRPDAFLSPRRRIFPDTTLLHLPSTRLLCARRAWIPPAGEAPRMACVCVGGEGGGYHPYLQSVHTGFGLLGTGGEGPGPSAGSWVKSFSSRWLPRGGGRATHTTHRAEVTAAPRPRAALKIRRDPLGMTLSALTRTLSGRGLCSMAPTD